MYSFNNFLKWRFAACQALYCFSRVWLCKSMDSAHQAPLFMGFSRQEYCGGLSCPSPGHLPNPGIEPTSFMSPALAGGFFTTSATHGPHSILPQQIDTMTSKRFGNCFVLPQQIDTMTSKRFGNCFVKYCTHKNSQIKWRSSYYISKSLLEHKIIPASRT